LQGFLFEIDEAEIDSPIAVPATIGKVPTKAHLPAV
jgi:hypothetical protein